MTEMWNKRYAQSDFVYGKEPNEFFKEQLALLAPNGKALFPGEGEGRNAVYASKLGWDVVAFDSSIEAKKKAEKLALENNTKINYSLNSFDDIDFEENTFDLIVLIFVHTENRLLDHQKLIRFLRPGGMLILEGFTKEQIQNNTGGPKSLELLFSKEKLEDDFAELSELKIWEEEIFLKEGEHYQGKANVIRLIGKK